MYIYVYCIYILLTVYGKPRVCGYDACYYCYECHQNDEAYIPARIVFNWDFRKQKGTITISQPFRFWFWFMNSMVLNAPSNDVLESVLNICHIFLVIKIFKIE